MRYLTAFSLCFLFVSSGFCRAPFKEIKPDITLMDYVGRFDFTHPGEVRFDWTGTYFRCRFTGSQLGLRLDGPADIYYDVFIDKLPVKVISSGRGNIIWIATNLKKTATHSLTVYKRTEGMIGISVFKGLAIDQDAKIIRWKTAPSRRIEFIGNSITCGYGAEGASSKERFKPATENSYLSYASVLSRAFNADYHIEAHSGIGVVRQYGDSLKVSVSLQMPQKFSFTFDSDTVRWNFSAWKPDMLVINLGTNDFSTHPYPDKAVFQRAYENLIRSVRDVYGNIPVFCLAGPLINEPCYSYIKESVESLKTTNNDQNVYFIGIPGALLNTNDDLGSDAHPSAKGQRKIASFILPVISNVMQWNGSL